MVVAGGTGRRAWGVASLASSVQSGLCCDNGPLEGKASEEWEAVEGELVVVVESAIVLVVVEGTSAVRQQEFCETGGCYRW